MIIIMRTVFLLIVYCSMVYGDCRLQTDEQSKDVYEKMKKWKVFGTSLTVSNNGSTYSVGICSSPVSATDAAAIVRKDSNASYVLGKLDQVSLVGGDNWILLTYGNGEHYAEICNNSTIVSSIMFVCGQNMANISVLRQNIYANDHTNYMFQLQVPEICPIVEHDNKLSGFTIFLIVIGSIAAAYLIIGGIYRHIMYGARGLEHIPNIEVWHRLGNLAADGCDYCCRCDRIAMRNGYLLEENAREPHDADILSP